MATVPANDLSALAADYVTLWSRTFPTLVRHLRGRPEHALHLWCNEVYPYLRGERRAARVESRDGTTTRIALAGDLPTPYLAGLLEAFVGLSGARTEVRHAGGEVFEVRHRIHPADRLARAMQSLAVLRIPLLLTGALSVLVGTGLAWTPMSRWWEPVLVLAGALSAQAAANALQALRRRGLGPFDPVAPRRGWLRFTLVGGYLVAAAVAAWFTATGRSWVLAFGAAGLATSLAYPWLRDHALGPVSAALVHGPLILLGTLYAMTGALAQWDLWVLLAASAPVGGLTGAILWLDDMADRPLDEARGRRTLAVRLPRGRHLLGYTALVATGLLGAFALAFLRLPASAAALALVTIPPALILVRMVQRHLDDPRRLASARLGTLALHTVTATTLAAVLWSLP